MTKRADVLANRQQKTRQAQNIVKGLKALGEDVTLKEVGSNLDKYQALLNERLNIDTEGSLTEEQQQTIKNMNEYYDLLLSGTEDVYFDSTFKRISIIDGDIVPFELAIVPPHLIKERTVVINENRRNQNALNEHNLEYILKTLRDIGQQLEAEGYIPEGSDKIHVIDGSSRLQSCYLAQKPFKIWVARRDISSKTAKERSGVANDYKSLSFWESCDDVIKLKKEGFSNIEIAKRLKISEGRVSIAIGARQEIPSEVYKCFQSVTSIPREAIEKLVPAWRALVKTNTHNAFLKDVLPFEKSGFENDEQVLTMLLAKAGELAPKKKAKTTQTEYEKRAGCMFKQKINKKKGTCRLDFIDISPETLNKIEAFLAEL